MNLTMIVSNDDSMSNQLWNILEKCDFFNEKLINKTVIVGEEFYNTIPIILPNKRYIVISKNLKNKDNNVIVFRNNYQLLRKLELLTEEFILVSDEKMYNFFLPYINKVYLVELRKSDNKILFDSTNFCKKIMIDNNEFRMIEYRKEDINAR
ncbi:MAG: dihydrofolate reductase [Bacilli bacterium]|nr:dihydrofolate reductase [Bacilli bacterium]